MTQDTSAQSVYVEQDCTIVHENGTYTANGAVVTPGYARGYLGRKDGRLVVTTWHGEVLGTAHITSTWKMPHSYVSDRMYQVEATIDGRTYTGRSAGEGMVWHGRIKAAR